MYPHDQAPFLTWSRIYALQESLDEGNAPMTADGSTEQQETDEASVTINGKTLYYATLEEAFDAANGQTATITMLNDAECVHSGSAGSPLNITGGTVTLNMNEKTLSGNGYGNYGIINVSGGSLLVQGEEGKVKVTGIGLSCNESGKLTVEGITLELVGDDIAVAGVDNEGGTVVLNGTQMTGAASDGQIYQYSGTTTINNVTATGTTENYPKSVWYYNEGTLTINGGTFDKITVDSDNYSGVTSIAELLGEGCAYKKQDGTWATDDELAGLEISNVTVEKIPLTIHPKGDTSWFYSNQQTHTLAMNAAPVSSDNSVAYVWKNGNEKLDCTSDACAVPADTPVGSYTYTCEATCDGYTLSHTFTFKIEKSGTEFTGGIKTFNGSEETTTFTAGDTITVKATPTATGTAPKKAAARLLGGYTEPTAGQMALFVGDVQVSEPVEAGADGTYIMTVSASKVLLQGNAEPNGNAITLTAKFVGNDNMADAAGTVDVRISAVAMAEKDGTVIGYYGESNLADAFAWGSGNAGATITLLDNITTSTQIDVDTENLTLDLNGKTYTYIYIGDTDIGDTAFLVSSGSLTVKGSGAISASSSYCLSVYYGTLNIKSGSFSAKDSAVYVVDNATLQLTGGSFTGDQSAIAYESGEVTEALANYGGADAPHYAFYQGSSPYAPSGNSLPSGIFTVKECTHIFDADGLCAACGSTAVARVTIGDAVTYYGDIPSAWAAVQGQTASLHLLKSVDATGEWKLNTLELASGSVTLDMAEGVTLSSANDDATIIINGGTLTVNSGTVNNTKNCGIQNKGGTLRITGGTFQGSGYGYGVWADSGITEISNGTIGSLSAQKSAKFSLSGGSFDDIWVHCLDGGDWVVNLLAEGYAFKKDGVWVTNTSDSSLTGTVTVEKALEITAQPTDSEVTYGEDAALSVTAEAVGESQTITYQWYQVGENGDAEITSTTLATHTASGLGAGTYQYYCTVTCDGCTVKSKTVTVTVKPRQLTPTITGTASKTYDGTTDVPSGQLSIALDGVVNGDDVTATASYAYDTASAGENKTITASGITLEGDSKDNYTLSSTTATTTGTITKSQPSIAFASSYNPGKDYDGQAIPNPTADNLTITGANFSGVTFTWSATPKDAGTYILTAVIPETTNTEAASDTLTVTIRPKTVTPTVTITPGSYEYTGSAICPSGSAVKVMDGNTVIPNSEYTLSYGENTQAGEGSVTVTDKENGNYTITQTTETFTITKANQATLTITGAPGSVTYGDTFQLGFSGGSGIGAVSWGASGATVDNAGNVTITSAGTVIITVGKDGDSNYYGTEGRITLNIGKKALTVSGADTQDRAYDGTNKVAITAVTLDGIAGSDTVEVDVSGIQGTLSSANAGTYTSVILPVLTLTGADSGNYTLEQPQTAVPASVKITPLDAVITIGTDTYHKTFGDAKFTLDVTDNNTEADARYEVTKGADVVDLENGTVTILNAGTAEIRVSLPASANYTVAEGKTITVTVDKKSGYTVDALDRSYYYQDRGTDSIDLGLLLPKDCGNVTYGEPAVSGNVAYSVDPAVSGGKLSYTLDSGNINEEGAITVTVTTRNFEDITVTVNVKLTDKIPVSLKTGTEVTLKNTVLTYGKPLSDLVFNEAEFVGTDGKTVTGTLEWKEAAATPNAGTASAVWVFTPAENKYASLEGTVAITVNKAVPTVSAAPAVADRIYNPSVTLKGDDLSGSTVTGVDGSTLEGTWNWQGADIVPTVTGSGYAAIFTPEDTTNYETVTRTITVNVTKATPYIAGLPAAAGITYGEMLNDSVLSGGTVQYGNGAGQAGDGAGSTAAVAGTFTWKEPSVKPVAADSNVTEYTVVFTPSDTVNFDPVEAKATLTVNKAQNAPNMPGSTMDVSNSLEKVGDVSLPEGWEWQASDQDTALEAGKTVNAVAVYTGADKGNYEKETVTVAITRSACDHVAGEIVYTGAGEKAPTCTEDGLGHRECSKCGSVVESDIVVKALGHTGGTATCSQRAVCTRCGQPYGVPDGSVHGETEVSGFVAATCTAGGYTGDTYCKDCGTKLKTGTATSALGHNYESEVTKEPTQDSEGIRTYTCTLCGDSYTESIDKLEPSKPSSTPEPGATTKPGNTPEPGATTQPGNTPEPGTTPRPGDTPEPGSTPEPEETTKPGSTPEPGETTKPDNTPEPGKPFIKDADGKHGWDVIRAEEMRAEEGSTINVDMNGTTVVPGDIFDSIKGRGITVTFDMGGGILWSVDGKSIITGKADNIDFSVKTGVNSIPLDIVNNITGERYSIQISLAHEGEFGFTAVLSINLGKENGGYTASLYYYNEGTGELAFICSDKVAEDGTVSLAFTHASDYVIAIDADEEEESGTGEAAQLPAGRDETGDVPESPRTGQEKKNVLWPIVAGIMALLVGAFAGVSAWKRRRDMD